MNDNIVIKGAREHNLKNIDVTIPKNSLVVVSGLSGSGKSSLAFDTIFAEGQRRYVESLSAYARQFLGRLEKPDVDSIDGLSPAIAIEQRSTQRNPRSTVGTVTEIYDYYRLLYARIGHVHCPQCGREISEMSVDQIIDAVFTHEEGGRLIVLSPVAMGRKGEFKKVFTDALHSRVVVDGRNYMLEEEMPVLDKQYKHTISIVVDRLVLRRSDRARLAEAIENATGMSDGLVEVAKAIGTSSASATPVPSAASPYPISSRGSSRSTILMAPVPTATDLASRASSTYTRSFRTLRRATTRAQSSPILLTRRSAMPG